MRTIPLERGQTRFEKTQVPFLELELPVINGVKGGEYGSTSD